MGKDLVNQAKDKANAMKSDVRNSGDVRNSMNT
jgi:hypothetical protein